MVLYDHLTAWLLQEEDRLGGQSVGRGYSATLLLAIKLSIAFQGAHGSLRQTGLWDFESLHGPVFKVGRFQQ